jgi:fluoroacetyl-CoA thioesterase
MEIGAIGEFTYTVVKQDLASEVAVSKEDVFPEVLATSRMIGLMEVSAARLMKPLLKDGELSVGVGVIIKHFAPTPIDEEVKAIATFMEMDKTLYSFKVEVFDRAGKVASGTHTRAIVEYDKIMKGAKTRMDSAE